MKPNYDQLIWEACGSPTLRIEDKCADFECNQCRVKEIPIDITLAHVIDLLFLKGACEDTTRITCGVKLIFRFANITISWTLLKENNEAANFADQSDETKEAICKVVGLI